MVTAGGSEKSQRLQLLQEFSVPTLLVRRPRTAVSSRCTHASLPSYQERHIGKVSVQGFDMSEAATEAVRSGAAVRVYSLRVHETQPHILALATSVGLLVLALPAMSVCPMVPAMSVCLLHRLMVSLTMVCSLLGGPSHRVPSVVAGR